MNKLILASKSPRRRELLSRLGLEFTVLAAQADETLLPGLSPREQVIRLSAIKAQAVREALESRPGQVIVSADTVVVLDDAILGKPKDAAQAAELYLDELLRSAAQEADVSLSQACRDLDAGAFYTALTQPQDTAQTGAETPEDQAESDGSTQEPGT